MRGENMPIRRLYIILFFLCLAISGSVAAWFYIWEDMPKKSPTKAKQVYINQSPDNIAKYSNTLFA
jgi:hypothetical protein